MKVAQRLAALAVCSALGLFGCSGSSGNNGPRGCDVGVASCATDSQCPAHNACNSGCCAAIQGCQTSDDCASATAPHCDAASHTCKPCSSDAQCSGGRICSPSGACVAGCNPANNNSDCAPGQKCHASANGAFCAQCATGNDCPVTQPVCTAIGTCFGCNSANDCSGATPACDTTTHQCVPCLDAQNTSGGTNAACKAPTPACQGGVCVTCNAATNDPSTGANGACAAPNAVCTADSRCVQCTADTQCAADQFCVSNVCTAPALSSLTPSAQTIQVNQPATITVALDRAARVATNVTVTITSGGGTLANGGVAQVAAGATNGTVGFTGPASAGTTQFSATLNGVTKTASIGISAQPPTLSDFSGPSSVQVGGTAQLTVTVTPAPAQGSTVQIDLTSSNNSLGTVPASVQVDSTGTNTFTYSAVAPASAPGVTITATQHGTSTAKQLTISNVYTLQALAPSRTLIGYNQGLTLTVSLASSAATDVPLTATITGSANGSLSSSGAAQVASANLTLLQGQSSLTFNVYTTQFNGSDTSGFTVTVAAGGGSQVSASVVPYAAPGHVVISQFTTAGPLQSDGGSGAADEFTELYNPTNAPINLGTKQFMYRSATGAQYSVLTAFDGGNVIPAHGYWLIANPGLSPSPGYTYQPGGTVAPDTTWTPAFSSGTMAGLTTGGHVRVAESSAALDAGVGTAGVDDTFGYGTAGFPEAVAADAGSVFASDGGINTPAAWQRRARCTTATGLSTVADMIDGGIDENQGAGCDTDTNGNDFIGRPQRQPHNSTSGKFPPNALP